MSTGGGMGGSDDLRRARADRGDDRPVLVTGGAGFVGTNLADRLLSDGHSVVLFDNLSRPGVEQNVRWLREKHGMKVRLVLGDIRERDAVRDAVAKAREVFHFAAQVAVTTSLVDPLTDFGVNAVGTLNLLTALADLADPPPLLFTSTNKVYGALDDVALTADGRRYEPVDAKLREYGVDESRPLDFHSPYGCSKGAADQYVLDFARSYGLRTIVFRMSCIYGPHQFGTEDQGWVAHFLIRALRGEKIVLYGDGMQVRDLLFVEDLVDAFLIAQEQMPKIAGGAFNIGGGAGNARSLLEVLDDIAEQIGHEPEVEFDDWRPGDQRYYVSDTTAFQKATGWSQRTSFEEGLPQLKAWLEESVVGGQRVPLARRAAGARKRAAAPSALAAGGEA